MRQVQKQMFMSPGPGDWTPRSMWGRDGPPGGVDAVSSLCPHAVFPVCMSVSLSLLPRTQVLWDEVLPWSPAFILISSLKTPISNYSHVLRSWDFA